MKSADSTAAGAMRFSLPKIILAILILVVALLALFNYVLVPQLIAASMNQEPPPAVVQARRAEQVSSTDEYHAVGTVEAVNGVEIAAEVGGTVRSIGFRSGEMVAKSEVLVTLDTSTETADVDLARAALTNARERFKRVSALAEKGFASNATLDQARAELDQARAQLERARSGLGKRVIRAPFSGRAGIRQVDLGQYLAPGDPIVTLQQVDPIYVNFDVPQQMAGEVAVGQKVDVTSDSTPDRNFVGRISSIESRIDPVSRTLRVQATLGNGDGALTPGAFVNVAVIGAESTPVVRVPETAISYNLYGDSLWHLVPAGQQPGTTQQDPEKQVYLAHRRAVTVGTRRDGYATVLRGARPGDLIVTAGQLKLREDAKAVVNNVADLTRSGELSPY